MFPSFLITLREVIEASLIVATIIGILTKLGQTKHKRTVWLATLCAFGVSVLLLISGSMAGFKMQEIYSGSTEAFIEGTLMIISAAFITWAVFFLHNYFGHYKTKLLSTLKEKINLKEQGGLFILVFTAVFREGFEIVLFLSTVYFSSNPLSILSGFGLGAVSGLLICFGLFTATLRMPVFWAFRTTSALLILFAAGLLAHGTHELVESGVFAATPNVYLPFLPEKLTFTGSIIQAIFGVTKTMEVQTLLLYLTYTAVMTWRVFVRPISPKPTRVSGQDRLNTYR